MSLINCPSCRKKISSKAKKCTNCQFSLDVEESEIDRVKVIRYREYRDKTYRLKMLSYLAIAITMVGVVPMVWDYTQAINYGFIVSLTNHWGIYFVEFGFLFYVVIRYLMVRTKRQYKSNK